VIAHTDPRFESLLGYLQRSRGLDLAGYKRPGLMRRVSRRIGTIGVQGFAQYIDFLEAHPEELAGLVDAILIHATAFFRDPPAWDFVRGEVVPSILARKAAHDPVRIWSAGCASGEEAYSLAMLFAEAMGIDQFKARARIYATDVRDQALAQARRASYPEKDLEAVNEPLRQRYFERAGGRAVVRNVLRGSVIFCRHDLVHDAPISRLDLLACRNTIMYFDRECQSRVLRKFHCALNGDDDAGGYLFLGSAEMPLLPEDLFSAVQIEHRIFSSVRPASNRTLQPPG
jgi:two-component system CheB/CheR fusion protein